MRRNIYDRLSERREREERLEREHLEAQAQNDQIVPQKRFFTNEISFLRPQSLKDKTFHVFSITDSGPSPLSVVIGRSQVGPGADIELLSQQLLDDINKSLSHLQWVEYPTPVEVAGMSARRLEYTWRQEGRPVHQIQFVFVAEDEGGLHLLLQITGTSNSLKGMPAEDRCIFYSIVESVQLRSDNDCARMVGSDE
ncbi:DUF1795 domain-containing protein [Pseudomonas promysalinigenes]|uniref:DUF1795 domain-containing protein n=1 Tax=Pseudomonas promysalinigenes TaxID=485898 RepID=A0ABY6AT99_9PSED|nr:DUF1795 domain-containing protein [Pseudomonas promysalinigenes]UXH42185.1 DUF1795 domain-containing protein [Pseudomonas promysalinigenes]